MLFALDTRSCAVLECAPMKTDLRQILLDLLERVNSIAGYTLDSETREALRGAADEACAALLESDSTRENAN